MRMLVVALLTTILLLSSCLEQTAINPLDKILASQLGVIQNAVDSIDKYETQIIYTQVDRDENNIPHLNSYAFNQKKDAYFYPASTVKMPVAFLALQRINEITQSESNSIDLNSVLIHGATAKPQTPAMVDSTSENGMPSVGRYIEKIFAVSDNDAYNRLYEFLGQDYINDQLKAKGIFTNSRIRTRVGISGFNTESNRYTNPVKILSDDGEILYQQPEQYAIYEHFSPLTNTQKGVGYWDSTLDSVVMTPFDMSEKNFINLGDLEQSLIRVMMPELFDENERYNLTEDQYTFLYETMQKTPKEFPYLVNNGDSHADSYVKFFVNGDSDEPIPDYIRVFNKVGWSYGYLTDCSYIIDTKNKIEFYLTATIHVNANEIFNDDNYEFESVGLPFFSNLGSAVYQYELTRQRKVTPDLSRYIEKS